MRPHPYMTFNIVSGPAPSETSSEPTRFSVRPGLHDHAEADFISEQSSGGHTMQQRKRVPPAFGLGRGADGRVAALASWQV